MKNVIFLLWVLSCSNMTQHSKDNEELPNWVHSPYDFCSGSSQICASGEASDFHASDAEAKSNLASIFEIYSNSASAVSLTEEKSVHQLEMRIRSDAAQSLQQSANSILAGSEIKARFKKEGVYFSLATLDRTQATELLNDHMTSIDLELAALWKLKKRTLTRKMLLLSAQRSLLEEKLAILTPVYKPAAVSFEQILDWSRNPKTIKKINLKIAHAPKWLSDKLTVLLEEAGLKLSKTESRDVVTVNVTSIKEFLAKEGYEKYTFNMRILHIDDGAKVGQLSKVETVIGRNQEDALLKVKKTFNHYLQEELYHLNLD